MIIGSLLVLFIVIIVSMLIFLFPNLFPDKFKNFIKKTRLKCMTLLCVFPLYLKRKWNEGRKKRMVQSLVRYLKKTSNKDNEAEKKRIAEKLLQARLSIYEWKIEHNALMGVLRYGGSARSLYEKMIWQ